MFRTLSTSWRGQHGTALVISLLLLTALSLIGVYSVFTSTVETRIAGNERVLEVAFYAADGGVDYGRQMVELVLGSPTPSFPSGATVSNQTAFEEEVRGFQDHDPDPSVGPMIGNCSTTIQVGRTKAENLSGGSAEFGSGEGLTKAVYYLVDAGANSAGNTQSAVEITYRRVIE